MIFCLLLGTYLPLAATGAWRAENDSPRVAESATPRSVFPAVRWLHKEPASLGLESGVLDEIVETAGGRAGMIVRYGYVAREWGDIVRPVDWASAAKPLLSTLLFLAVGEERLPGVHASIHPRWPTLRERDRSITFHQLANNVSGYGLPERPGRAWAYNDYGMNLLCGALRWAFGGQYVVRVIKSRLSALGFEDDIVDARRGCAVDMSVRDMARIATLWLRGGQWGDESVLDSKLLARSLTAQVRKNRRVSTMSDPVCDDYIGVGTFGGECNPTPLGPGAYGYGFWFNEPRSSRPWPDAPRSTFVADGLWGANIVVVIPELELVAVIRGEQPELQQDYSRLNDRLKLLRRAVVR